ncbi:MAG: tRNA 2-thiouridine(34) synthase MnmA [Tissierellales bacterium]|jgi:tRNA-specific 2-thiouridylase|nr:tRNA 2-thiouridine(34) synthase MnmA [Tissierellales bacterium]
MKKKVVIGMSGGVDSAVAAHLLKEAGYDVIGIMMKFVPDDDGFEDEKACCSLSAVTDARMVADQLDIPFYVMNFKKPFKEKVIDYFVDEYTNGRTPNPCVMCNKKIKFDALYKRAKALGADYIATGHYAQIVEEDGRYQLKKGIDERKDQTYMLYTLTQEQLAHTLMPCGTYNKDEVREIAESIGLHLYKKRDSQEICFVPDNSHGDFICDMLGNVKEGNFVDKEGNVLGRHKGIVYYTIGQRKGLGIAIGKPAFVIDINAETNEIVIGDNDDLMKKELIAEDVNLIYTEKLDKELKVMAKIRYNGAASAATIYPIDENTVKVVFEEEQRAITKGQSVVFYKEGYVVGGGIIEKIC